jgi:hypothetical protein
MRRQSSSRCSERVKVVEIEELAAGPTESVGREARQRRPPGLARLLLSERSVDTRIDENLIENLLMEMAQTERSSTLHPRREAERLGTGATLAIAFLAVADHADRVLPELERLAGPKNGALGSYHGTLAGLHHRIDYALLTHAVSARGGRSEVAEFLARWFDGRQPLVASCQRAVTWFAAHPDTAIERAG